jgi:uncharacterized membrane protein YraQ (UPF0718 family)
MDIIVTLATNFSALAIEASPWLLLGLIIAGLMKSWLPSQILSKHLGSGKLAIVKAAFIGAPLPLCSCGVIPVATQLRRSGASAPATASFLVATPETGVDSVSVSYALLGPVMAIYRPISAITSAIITGFLVTTAKAQQTTEQPKTKPTKPCCASKKEQAQVEVKASSCCSSKTSAIKQASAIDKTLTGFKYAFSKLIDDLIGWLLVGLTFATLIKTFLPTSFLIEYGSGLPAMLLMIAISIPMYICATASTPVAAGLIMAGISPGTALVFMMAGPATNISTLGVIKNEMGTAVLSRYLVGIGGSAIVFGSLLDTGLTYFNINIGEQMSHSHELLPYWLGASTAIFIALAAIKPLRRFLANLNLFSAKLADEK